MNVYWFKNTFSHNNGLIILQFQGVTTTNVEYMASSIKDVIA